MPQKAREEKQWRAMGFVPEHPPPPPKRKMEKYAVGHLDLAPFRTSDGGLVAIEKAEVRMILCTSWLEHVTAVDNILNDDPDDARVFENFDGVERDMGSMVVRSTYYLLERYGIDGGTFNILLVRERWDRWW